MDRIRRSVRRVVPALVAIVVVGCGSPTSLPAEQWAWCSDVQHMSREVGDEARTLNLAPPANDAGITDYAYYWAYYYYRKNRLAELRSEPGFVRACQAAYQLTH